MLEVDRLELWERKDDTLQSVWEVALSFLFFLRLRGFFFRFSRLELDAIEASRVWKLAWSGCGSPSVVRHWVSPKDVLEA